MRISPVQAIAILVMFCATVIGGALVYHRQFPILVFAGEDSVVTWLSGALLIFCAAMCFHISITQQWRSWLLLAAFFMVLALDERFMFHERLKEWILFSSGTKMRWLYELPVIVASVGGLFVTIVLWRETYFKSRMLLVAAAVLGSVSVVIDIFASGVVWEECFKMFGEILLVSALLIRIGPEEISE
jgi:hypothetical protein